MASPFGIKDVLLSVSRVQGDSSFLLLLPIDTLSDRKASKPEVLDFIVLNCKVSEAFFLGNGTF